MKTFEHAGKQNTEETLKIAIAEALKRQLDLVISSSTGASAQLAAELAEQAGYKGQIIIVATAATAASKGVSRFNPQIKAELKNKGISTIVSAHALSAGERGISARHHGISPLEIMADTLRTFGAGTKVCYECAIMALDSGELDYGKPVIAVGGTGGGLDTALIITPSYSSTILDTVVHEFLVKPTDIRRIQA